MPLDRDIQDLIDESRADESSPRPVNTTLDGARLSHENDASRFTPQSNRAAVGRVDTLEIPCGGGPVAASAYWPERADDDRLPTILWVHGGGWTTGSLATGDIMARELCAGTESVVVSIDYRLAPENPWPAATADVADALAWIRNHIDELGAEPGLVAIGGDSAGGNLAAAIAQQERTATIPLAAQILIYPFLDLNIDRFDKYASMTENATGYYVTLDDLHWCVRNYVPDAHDRDLPSVSPLMAEELEGTPPAVIAVAEFDPLRDQGLEYSTRLRDSRVPVNEHFGSGLIHGYADMIGRSPTARTEIDRVLQSIRHVLPLAIRS